MPSSTAKLSQTSWNPLAFVPAQVTFFGSVVYLALGALLLYTHLVVPPSPSPHNPSLPAAVNLSAAAHDLAVLTDGFHPFQSRRNTVVRDYLLERLEEILQTNRVGYKVVEQRAGKGDVERVVSGSEDEKAEDGIESSGMWMSKKKGSGNNNNNTAPQPVTIFRDDRANATFVNTFGRKPWTSYGESQNILVYIRGEDDAEQGEWWRDNEPAYEGPGGVLVSAHFDSVASGYGATDDGVGVISILQLIAHFTAEGHRPRRGLLALLNDGEEAALFGGHMFVRHKLSQLPHMFLNLEGAGGGGRALLFRSTDAEVTGFYSKSPSPFGNVVSSDGFKLGLVGSGTDYSIFVDTLGMRGLDLAFFEPRARYHTEQDDARDTSPASVWHMLSAGLATIKEMTSYDGDEFEGNRDRDGKLELSSGSTGVWFDLFGRTFAVFQLHTLFPLSVTLLVVGPLILIALQIILTRLDRWYPLSRRQIPESSTDDRPIHFSGLRGLFRFPIAFTIATAAVLALAYLLAKINPYIVYSSEYAVWAMMLSAWFAIAWFFFAGAAAVRPTALHRMYTLIWMYALSWVAMVFVAVGENNLGVASGYFVVIYHASVFVATLISYLELFALPSKTTFMEHMVAAGADEDVDRQSLRPESRSSRNPRGQGESRSRAPRGDDGADESTSLLSGSRPARSGGTFTGIAKRRNTEDDELAEESGDPLVNRAYGDEQAWSSSLPQWLWIVQFIILGPINIILVGQIGLVTTSALHMTPADGNPVLNIYLMIATLSVALLLPLAPFLHRFKYQVPTLLFAIFIGCLIYSLLAFPFSRDARVKFYWTQRVDLDTAVNTVAVTGLDGYVQDIAVSMPSAMGQHVHCELNGADDVIKRSPMSTCSWVGLDPNVTADVVMPKKGSSPKVDRFRSWLSYNVSHRANTASVSVRGRDAKVCRIVFDQPVADVVIADAAYDPRFETIGTNGTSQVHLFAREWEKTFHVNVSWPLDTPAAGQKGEVHCLWSDANEPGAIPAFTEALRFAPVWSVVTEGSSEGLVEGFVKFEI